MKLLCKKYVSVWGFLLGLCRNYGNVELLEFAVIRYFELDLMNGGNYVVFVNGYASCGLLEVVLKVRRRMENVGVEKDLGYS